MDIQFSKRIQSPLHSKSLSTQHGTPKNQSPALVMNDDDSERRERRLSRLFERQILESPRGSLNPLANLNAVQLAEHYTNCMRLSTQNKINQKNAFQLQLIDYMAMMLRKKEPQMDNFQVASCTLDASTKIYACRVDNIYNDSLKLAAGFSRVENVHNDTLGLTEEEPGITSSKSGTRKKTKRSSMIEVKLDRLNVKERERSNPAHCYFRRMTEKLDEGQSGGCHLFHSLRFLGDSRGYSLDKDESWWRERKQVHQPLASVQIPAPNFSAINSAEICPALSSFTFIGWKPEAVCDGTSSSRAEDMGASQVLERDVEHSFDINVIPEEIPMEEELVHEAIDELEIMERVACSEDDGRKTSWEYTSLRNSLTHSPGEYSYFKKAEATGWSGPIHWKVKPILRRIEKPTLKKKAKVRLSIDYEELANDDDFKVPQKSVHLKNTTIESWSDERMTLPIDLSIYPKNLPRLFLKPQMILQTKETRIIEVDGLRAFNFDNTNDLEDYCPNLVVDGPTSNDRMECYEMGFSPLPDIEQLATAESGYDLVPAPPMVPQYSIPYALHPTRLNIKRLQEEIYKIMTQRENEKDAKEGVPASAQESEGVRGIFKFVDVYKKILAKLPAKEAKVLSIPTAFVTLLHVASTKNLHLQECNNLDDVTITQNVNEGKYHIS